MYHQHRPLFKQKTIKEEDKTIKNQIDRENLFVSCKFDVNGVFINCRSFALKNTESTIMSFGWNLFIDLKVQEFSNFLEPLPIPNQSTFN